MSYICTQFTVIPSQNDNPKGRKRQMHKDVYYIITYKSEKLEAV